MNDKFMSFGAIRLTDLGTHVHPLKQGKICNCDKCKCPSWLTDKQKGMLATLDGMAHILCLQCIKVTKNEKLVDISKPNYKPDSIIEEILRSDDGFGGI